MLQKVTGISTVEFLTARLFEPLGIPVPVWECDHSGVEVGGWGIFLSATDFAKIALCLLNDGVYDNKQIIPSEWVAQTSVNRKVPKSDNEEDLGYGYGVWVREGKNPIIRFDGLFGQVAEIYKNYDAVTVVIGGDIMPLTSVCSTFRKALLMSNPTEPSVLSHSVRVRTAFLHIG